MKKNTVRKLAVWLVLMMIALVVEPVRATTISDLQKDQKALQEQRNAIRRQQEEEQEKLNNAAGAINSMESQADAVGAEIDEIDESLVEILASVEMINDEILIKEDKIVETTVQYEAAKAAEDEQYEAMKLRVRFMYEQGDSSYLQIFLDSSSLGEMLNKAEYVEKLYEYDRKLLAEFKIAREATLALKEQLEEEKSELEAQQHELAEEQNELERVLAVKQQELDNYEVKLAQAKQQAAIYKANIKSQNDQIRKLEKEEANKKAQEIAAVKAAEEARKAEEANISAAQNTSGQTEKSNTSDTGGSSGKSYASPGSFGGSKGQQVAGYACQFVGNPYVSGGTSLTSGADCSGFVWRIFSDFGYSVPRTSWSCREAGTGVSYADAQPGDIICYAGHVGIYIGNGNIVHASTQKTGIKITAATYKEILAVRRIV